MVYDPCLMSPGVSARDGEGAALHSAHSQYGPASSPSYEWSHETGDFVPSVSPLDGMHTGEAEEDRAAQLYREHGGETGTSDFNPLDNALVSPSNFDPHHFSPTFVLPRFANAGSRTFELESHTPAIMEAASYSATGHSSSSATGGPAEARRSSSFLAPPTHNSNRNVSSTSSTPSSSAQPYQPNPQTWKPTLVTGPPHMPSTPVYDLYGSSVISVNYDSLPSRKLPRHTNYPSTAAPPSNFPPFNPAALGLPLPPSKELGDTNWKGLYSSSGFDMMGVLARVASRPNPQILIGPVDASCSILVVDAKKWDFPIVYASQTFSAMTGYSSKEIVGKNCRFLQSPDGIVAAGARRQFTDENAVWHLKKHVEAERESQTSLINYFKGGRPFINLVTIIPITWDSDEIAYYVGFQVDLVEQPSAILERMKNGTYVVNYSLLNSPILQNHTTLSREMQVIEDDANWIEPQKITAPPAREVPPLPPSTVNSAGNTGLKKDEEFNFNWLDQILNNGVAGLPNDNVKKGFHKLLLNESDDLIHVLSLKGSVLYASPSAKRLLEYEPSELTGKSLSTLCHPSDIVAVLRELKESGATAHSKVNLVYRIRRKHSGYLWMEASGSLYVEQGKGRKCVILVGRARAVYKMSWADLSRMGGFGQQEFWSKLSAEGMHLYTTSSVEDVLGFTSAEILGTSMAQITDSTEVLDAIKQVWNAGSHPITVRYFMKSRNGLVDVVSHFYPNRSLAQEQTDLSPSSSAHFSVIAQTNLYSSSINKNPFSPLPTLDPNRSQSASTMDYAFVGSPKGIPTFTRTNSRESEFSAGVGNVQSTYKALPHPATLSDNLFDELDSSRGTSWQFELHQLRLTNKKLREEKAMMAAVWRTKVRNRSSRSPSAYLPSPPGSCANCGYETDEFLPGPNGTALCSSCGDRWSNSQSQFSSTHSLDFADSPNFDALRLDQR